MSDGVDGSVFLVLAGSRPMTRRAIQDRFMNLAAAAGIPPEKRFPHSMRNGLATRMLLDTETIGGIYTVSKVLGHSRVATTNCIALFAETVRTGNAC